MWRRPLNSPALVTSTHRRPKGVFDGTNTQVVALMINKCMIKMIQMKLYNIRDSSRREDQKFVRESTVAVWAIFVTIFNQYIREHTSSDCAEDKFYLDNSNPFLFDYLLKFILTVIPLTKTQFFYPLSTNLLYRPVGFEFTLLIGIVFKPNPYNWRRLWEELMC